MTKRKYPLTYKEFKEIYSKVPKLCVEVAIRTKKGYLLTFRTKNGWVNKWHLPGGTVHYREKISDCVSRVAEEELGVKVAVEKFLGYIEYFSEEKERGFGYSVSLVFLCKPLSDNYKLDDQAEKLDFFNKPPKNTVREHIEFFKRLEAK
ncbi:NUDIX hydrolase [Candidatus Woesebacteria bacterium]|nr:NUDIX hydrolase [Candidatus Woesebacteria bacterium]